MTYHFNKLNKQIKQKVLEVLKSELVELEAVKQNKNYIELSSQNSTTLNSAIDKGLYILRDKASHENNKRYITINKQLAHFILF